MSRGDKSIPPSLVVSSHAGEQQETDFKKLRMALAINRGMEELEKISTDAKSSTVEHHATKREDYLVPMFESIHRSLFRDWQKQPGLHDPGDVIDATMRDDLRKVVQEHLFSSEEGSTKLFDANGFVIGPEPKLPERKDRCATVLAEFYDELRKIRAFDYGNKMTRDFFMVSLGKLPAFKAVYGTDIDLSRLDEHDVEALHDKHSSVRKLKTAFEHALMPERTRTLCNQANGYDPWPKNVELIAHIRFLSHTDKQKRKYLVTANGGLVRLTDELKEQLENELVSGKILADIPSIKTNQLKGFLPGTESLREGYDDNGIRYIDGFRTTRDEAPLVCLDVNILSGLRPSSHQKLKDMIEQCRDKNTSVFSLNDNPQLKQELLEQAGDDKRLQRTVEVAYDHINHITKQLDELKLEVFSDKTPSENPMLFVCMGGAASGKSNVEELMNARYGKDKVVVASLDAFRDKSDLQKVLKAANHHADDYFLIEPFGNTLRDWVASHARGNRFNLLFDGTGILYQPRYSDLIGQFKKSGYGTEVVAFDREYLEAVSHVKSRARKENRGVPWSVVAGKHSRMPRSMLQVIDDPNMDKFSLYSNDGKRGDHKLIAETFSGGERPEQESFNLNYTVKGKARTLAIYDADRMVRVLDKGLLNPFASSPQNTDVPYDAMAFLPGGRPTWGQGK